PGRAEIESGRTHIGEADGWQIPFGHRADESARAQGVDIEAGEAFIFAIAFHRAVVDIVVAERAEIEIAQRALPVAASGSRRRIEPGRGMLPRQHETEVEGGENLGEEFGARIVAEERKARLITLLVIDRTERAREICVFQSDLGGGKA